MSDFSTYLLFQRSSEPAALLERLRVTGLVVPNRDPWVIVVTTAHERVRDESLLALELDYAADHGLSLCVYARGHRVAKLTAASEVGRRASFDPAPWVQHGLLKRAASQAIARLLARNNWRHEEVRDAIAKWIGFRPVSFLRPGDLDTRRDELRERFPDAVFVRDGAVTPWGGKPDAIDLAEVDVDFAACTTARAWLDARSRVVPDRAAPAVLRELERVVREGRFEGERAVVVREAAAMLLARCLAAQRGYESEAWLTAQRDAARSEAERAAWDTALARWLTAWRSLP